MPALPRYQQIGVEYGSGTKGIDFPSRGEMTAGYNALANTLDQMSQSFFKEAATAAKEEGERYGAENAPTPEQIAEARRLNQPIEPIGDARTFFGKAAKEASARIAAKNISVDAELELGKIQNDVAAGKIGANSITSRVNALAQGYTEALRQFDPLMARSVEADITLHGNKMFLAAQKKAMAEGVAAQALKTAEATEETFKNDIRNILANGDQLLQGPSIDGKPMVYTTQQQVDDATTKVENRINSLPLKQRKELLKNLPQWAQTEIVSSIKEKIIKADSEEDLKPVLKDLKSGKYDPFFTSNMDVRLTLVGNLESAITKFSAQDNIKTREVRAKYQSMSANIMAATAAGKEIDPSDRPTYENVMAVHKHNPEQGEKVWADIQNSYEFYDTWQRLKFSSDNELGTEYDKLKKMQQDAPLEQQAKIASRMTHFQNVIKMRNQALDNDPASYAMNLPEVRDTLAEANAITNDPTASVERIQNAWKTYADAQIQAQKYFGVTSDGIKILPRAEADSIISRFNNQTDGGQSVARFLAAEQNKWKDAWPMVMKQLHDKLPPSATIIASLVNRGQDFAASTLSQSLTPENVKALNEHYKERPQDSKTIREIVQSKLKDFRVTLSNPAIANGQEVYTNFENGVEQLARVYAWHGQSPSDAAKRAANDIINSAYVFEGTYRVPAGRHDTNLIIENANDLKREIGMYNIKIPPSISGLYKNVPPDQMLLDYQRQVAANGTWINTGNDDGLMLVDGAGNIVRGSNNRPITVSFGDLSFDYPRGDRILARQKLKERFEF